MISRTELLTATVQNLSTYCIIIAHFATAV